MSRREALLTPPDHLRRLQVEVTTACNLFCAECSRTVAVNEGQWTDSHMGLERFKTIVENSPPAEYLVLQGVGEPALNPELVEITRWARACGKFDYITLNTNAVTRSVEYFRRLREAGLTYVCVSIDSLTPEVAERCRSGTRVDKLVRILRGIYADYGMIVISMVASRLNMFDIPATLARLNEIGEEVHPAKRFVIEIQPVISYREEGGNSPGTTLSKTELERLRDMLKAIEDSFPRLVVRLNTTSLDAPDPGVVCARPLRSPYVTVDGFLTPCCTTFDPSLYQHTNLLFTPMQEAWRSAPVRDWLSGYLSNGHEICRGCCFDMGALLRDESSAHAAKAHGRSPSAPSTGGSSQDSATGNGTGVGSGTGGGSDTGADGLSDTPRDRVVVSAE